MVKKLIQACAVFIAVTAIIYGNKPIQPQQGFDTPFGRRTFSGGGTAGGGQGFGMTTGGGGSGAFRRN